MDYMKSFPCKYPGSPLPGRYDKMNSPGYVQPINNGLENANSLAHRFWEKPDFRKVVVDL